MFLDKKTKGFKFNLSLILWIFMFIWCVCVLSSLRHARAKWAKTPTSRKGAMPTVFGTGHPATHQPTKTIKKTLVYNTANSDKLIFIDKRGLNQ